MTRTEKRKKEQQLIKEWLKKNKPTVHKNSYINVNDLEPAGATARKSMSGGGSLE